MSKHTDIVGGRKFIIAACTGLAATLLQYMGKLDPVGNTYMLIMLGVIGGYMTGDVAETKVLGRKKDDQPQNS
jgi:hypothetical protein